MNFAPAGVSLSFEVTYDRDDLAVGMAVYDTSSGSPILVQGPALMALLTGFTYYGRFTADNNRSYVIEKRVYTDVTLATPDLDYAPGSESIRAEYLNGGGGGFVPQSVVGYVTNAPDPVGEVINTPAPVGVVEC